MTISMIDLAGKNLRNKEEVTMRFAFVALLFSVCGVAVAQDAGQPTSVLNHGQPTPAIAKTTTATETAPAPAPTPAPAAVAVAEPVVCANGTCTTRSRTRFRTVTEGCDACTGASVRSVTRGVVRGAGEVVNTVGTAAINVVAAPVRACRNSCRGSRKACSCR